MDYVYYLVQQLRALGVYDLRKGTINRGELEAYGALLDEGIAHLDETAREMTLATAESFGIENIEALLPYRPASETIEQRRKALAALLRIGGDSFTPEAINDTLSGCGINAIAKETGVPGYVEVSFPDVAGIPDQFDQLRVIIEEILPSHLEIIYIFWYTIWAVLGRRFATWGQAMVSGLSWYQMATLRDN